MSLRGQVFAGLLSRAVCALRPKRLPRCVPRTFVLGPKEGLTPLFWCLDGEAGEPLRRGRSRCLYLRFERPLRSGLVLGVRREKNTKGRCQKEPYVQEGEPAKPFSGPYHKSLTHYIMFWILLSRRNSALETVFQSPFLFFSYIIANLRFGCQMFLSTWILFSIQLGRKTGIRCSKTGTSQDLCGKHSNRASSEGSAWRTLFLPCGSTAT